MALETGFVRYPGQMGSGVISPRMLNARKMGRYVHDFFRARPLATAVAGGAATGSTGDINKLNCYNPWNVPYEYAILGAGQTIIIPVPAATGLDVALDNTADEGLQMIFGGDMLGTARGRLGYTIGTDPAFFAKLKLTLADASGTDEMYFGFRKAEAFTATVANYTDYASFAVLTKATAALVQTATNLNSGGQSAKSTTQTFADAVQVSFEVRVDAGGVVKFLLDGAPPTVTQSFTFDTGDVVFPYFHFLHSADVSDTVILNELEVGFLPE